MATIIIISASSSSSSSLTWDFRPNSNVPSASSSSLGLPVRFRRTHGPISIANSYSILSLPKKFRNISSSASEEETNIISVEEESQTEEFQPQEAAALPTTTVDQTVSVPVSPSDVLTMFFQAEGSMNEAVIPQVSQALEGVEGITDLKVKVLEGIASVELTKQTTVQATGVASSLVEKIQSSGFKLQTLNLSFQDEEDIK